MDALRRVLWAAAVGAALLIGMSSAEAQQSAPLSSWRVINGVLGVPYNGAQVQFGTPTGGSGFRLLPSVTPAFAGQIACPAGNPLACTLSPIIATGGTVGRAPADKLGDILNLKDFAGAKDIVAQPTADASAIINGLAPGRYTLTGGLYRIGTDVTVPRGVVLDVSPGSGFSFDLGKTMTWLGSLSPNISTQIFFGAATSTSATSSTTANNIIQVASTLGAVAAKTQVFGVGVPFGTYVTALNVAGAPTPNVQVSQNVTVANGSSLSFVANPASFTTTTTTSATSTSNVVPVSSASGIAAGYQVSGYGVPAGTTATISGLNVTLSAAPVLNAYAPLTFTSFSVKGLRFAKPEWWGAQNTYGYTTGRDDAPALNLAIAAVSSSSTSNGVPSDGVKAKLGLYGYYYSCEPVDIFVNQSVAIEVEGAGGAAQSGKIATCPSFNVTPYPNGYGAALLNIHGLANTCNCNVVDMKLHDFALENTAGSGATIGIIFNPEGGGYNISGSLQEQAVKGVSATGFAIGWVFLNTRQFKIFQSSSWNGVASNSLGVLVRAIGGGGSTCSGGYNVSLTSCAAVGDMDFENFQTVTCLGNMQGTPCTGTGAMTIQASEAGTYATGIRIQGTFYGNNGGVQFLIGNGGAADDFWILPGSQFDGAYCVAVNATANGADSLGKVSHIGNIHVDHVYHTYSLPCGAASHVYFASAGAYITGIFDDNNWFSGLGAPAVLLTASGGNTYNSVTTNSYISDWHVRGAVMTYGIAGQPAIWAKAGVTNGVISDNSLIGPSDSAHQFSSMAQLDAGTDYITYSNNSCSNSAATSGAFTPCSAILSNTNPGSHNAISDDGAAYTPFTPTLSCGNGSVGTLSGAGRYKKLGNKTASISLSIVQSGAPTCTTSLTAALPVVPQVATTILGRDFGVGGFVYGYAAAGSTSMSIVNASGSFPVQNSTNLNLGGIFETQ